MARFLVYILNLIFITVVGWILARIVRNLVGKSGVYFRASRSVRPQGDPRKVVEGETARDPVCGMYVSTELSHRLTRGGETLHFCSEECLERYKANAPKS